MPQFGVAGSLARFAPKHSKQMSCAVGHRKDANARSFDAIEHEVNSENRSPETFATFVVYGFG